MNFIDVLSLLGAIALFIPLLMLLYGLLFGGAPGGLLIVLIIIGAIDFGLLAYPISHIIENNETNQMLEQRYCSDLRHYRQINDENTALRKTVPSIQREVTNCESEIKEASDTLQKIYDANIIPRRYRDIYIAIYLYDWFSTSQSDDLDMALNMFVLEEIKEKLDKIIENQSEIILNQYMIMANQKKSMELQEEHSRMMHRKLDQIEASNEERNTYLRMIEGNTAATAYFAAADYIRSI